MNNNLIFPARDSKEVQNTKTYLLSLLNPDNRICEFLRNYYEYPGHLDRICMSIECLTKHFTKDTTYLDIGSFGEVPLIMKQKFPNSDIKALSYEGCRVGINTEGFYDSDVIGDPNSILTEKIDVEKVPFPYPDNTFDIISCFEVLEHLKFTPNNMIKEIKRTLKPNGVFVLTTPNINSKFSISKIVMGAPPQLCPHYHNIPGYGIIHPKEYTVEEVKNLLQSFDFKVKATTVSTKPLLTQEKFIFKILSIPIALINYKYKTDFTQQKMNDTIISVSNL